MNRRDIDIDMLIRGRNNAGAQVFVNIRRPCNGVCPADEAAVREALAAMIASAPGGVSFLDVSADPRMKRGDCILESELGVVDAGLETQLKAIENALAGKIKES